MEQDDTEDDKIWAKTAFVFYVACVRPVNVSAQESPWPSTVEQAQRLLNKDLERLYTWLVKDRWMSTEDLKKMPLLELAIA